MHMINNGKKRENQLHSVINNRNINLTASRLLLLSVITQYGSTVYIGIAMVYPH